MKKGIGPRALGSPLKQTKRMKRMEPQKKGMKRMEPQAKKDDPNVFTDTYNAATGVTNDPYYNPAKAKQYEKNAIAKYGSLEASRKAYKK